VKTIEWRITYYKFQENFGAKIILYPKLKGTGF
jgi:hypothetical protein